MNSTEDRVMAIIRRIADLPHAKPADTLYETLALDSLDSITIQTEIEAEFGIRVDDQIAAGWLTGDDVIATVRGRLA